MLQEDYTPLTFAPVISYKLVAGVFRLARGGCFLFSFLLTTEYTEYHGVFLSLLIVIQTNEVRKDLGNTRWGVTWMYTRSFVAMLLWMTMMMEKKENTL